MKLFLSALLMAFSVASPLMATKNNHRLKYCGYANDPKHAKRMGSKFDGAKKAQDKLAQLQKKKPKQNK